MTIVSGRNPPRQSVVQVRLPENRTAIVQSQAETRGKLEWLEADIMA
jgi:hypothetical protein